MFDFTPTLELVITEAEVAELTAEGSNLEEATESLSTAMKNLSREMRTGMTFTAQRIRIVGTDIFLCDFIAVVSAAFDVDGVTYLKLVTGDTIAIRFIVAE